MTFETNPFTMKRITLLLTGRLAIRVRRRLGEISRPVRATRPLRQSRKMYRAALNMAVLAAVAYIAFTGPRVRPVSAQAKCVAFSSSVIAREGPGRSFAQSGSLPAHAQITIIEQKNGWYHFISDTGVEGWQGSSAFEDCEGPAAPTATTEQIAVPQLPVNDSADIISGYDRDDFGRWQDADHDCQNTRHEVLMDESAAPVTFKGNSQCFIDAGEWHDPYTDTVITSASQLDVDHMVPLANAFISGAWQWSEEKKQAYMNFMADQDHLIAVESSTNRSKSDRGPEDWRPPNENYWCEYAQNWTSIKNTWGLTVTSSEQAALNEMLDTCPLPIVKIETAQTDNDTIPEKPAEVVVAPTLTASPQGTISEPEQTSAEGERTGAVCNDGSTSSSTSFGTCSGHGGVSEWLQATSEPKLESTQPVQEQVQSEQQQKAEPERERTGATCNDGWTSQSTGSGTCAGHGGVAEWLYGGEKKETESEPEQEPSGETEHVEETSEEEPKTTPEPQAAEPEPTAELTPEPTVEPEPEPEEEDSETVRTGAVCRDGSESSATGRGACSHHGGVDHWIMSND